MDEHKIIKIGNRKIESITDEEILEYINGTWWLELANYDNLEILHKGFSNCINKDIYVIKLSIFNIVCKQKEFVNLEIDIKTLEIYFGFYVANFITTLNWLIKKGFDIPLLETYSEV